MSSSIDPIRRAARLRRAARIATERAGQAYEPDRTGAPVPLDAPQPATPRAEIPPNGAVFDAQLLGQDGQKRGLRAGPAAIDSASATYNRIEWSGAKDRRARKGRIAKTEI
jgi:hypothetical protein